MAAHSSAPPFTSPPQMQPPVIPPMQMNTQCMPQGANLPFESQTSDKKQNDRNVIESEEAKLESKRKQDTERKKKEEEDKTKQRVVKQQDKSRPVSSTPISGTPWCVVWTGDGRVFFYNPSTRTSVWDRPEELAGRPDVDEAVANIPEEAGNASTSDNTITKDDKLNQNHGDKLNTANDLTHSESETSGENYDMPHKKMKIETSRE